MASNNVITELYNDQINMLEIMDYLLNTSPLKNICDLTLNDRNNFIKVYEELLEKYRIYKNKSDELIKIQPNPKLVEFDNKLHLNFQHLNMISELLAKFEL